MYEISDWTRNDSKSVKSYDYDLIKYFRMILSDRAEDVWELYDFDDEETLMETPVENLIYILEDQDVPEENIQQFRAALGKFERRT